MCNMTEQGEMASICAREGSAGHQGEFCHWKGCPVLEKATQRGGGITSPEGVQETIESGT